MRFLNQLQRITLCIFFLSLSFEIWRPFGNGSDFSIAKLMAIIYFLSIAPQLPQFIRIDNLRSVLLPVSIFFGLLTLINLYNRNEFFSEFFDKTIFLNIIIFWLLINHERKDYLILEKGMLSYALGSIVLCALFFAGIGVKYVGGRLSMFGANQNGLGLQMVISVIILITLVIQNRLKIGWYRYLILIAIPFMVIFIGKTGSRVSTIALVLAIMAGVLLYKSKTNLNKILMVLGGFLFLILIGSLLMQSDVLTSRMKAISESGDLGSRDIIWRTIIPIIEENPIIGIGRTGYDFQAADFFGFAYSPHNVILELLCYTGFIGLFIYMLFIYQIFIRGYWSYKSNGWLLPVLLIVPVMGLLLSGQILDYKIGWAIFAYILSTSAIKYQHQNMKKSTHESPIFY